MKTSARFSSQIGKLFRKGVRNWHNRILSIGIVFALAYIAVRLVDVLIDSLNGAAGGLLIAAAGIGLFQLWQQRHRLQPIRASEEDRLLGYILILSGVAIAPLCLFARWAQALDCIVILIGIACSHWGLRFFQQYSLPTFLIAVGILPNTTRLLEGAYDIFLPSGALERLMAWAGSLGLQLIGQSAVAEGRTIVMPAGSVLVAYGCNGLYMAVTMAVASFVLGLFLKQGKRAIALMMILGAVLALITNVPRIMVMALASAYWGDRWFHFWHDSWGGQIFVSGLFTIYYYAVMAVVKK
jgi:exosortase